MKKCRSWKYQVLQHFYAEQGITERVKVSWMATE